MRRIITNRTSNPAHFMQVELAAQKLAGRSVESEDCQDFRNIQIVSLPLREEPRLRGLLKPLFWRFARCSIDPVVEIKDPDSLVKTLSLQFHGTRKFLRSIRVPDFLLFFSVRGSAFDSFYFAKVQSHSEKAWEHMPSITPFRKRILYWLKATVFVASHPTLGRSRPRRHIDSMFLLEYRGIAFGDLLIAHGLRYDRRAGGDPALMRGFRRLSMQAVIMIEVAMALRLQEGDVFLGDEHTYLHWVYARSFTKRGVPSIGFIDGDLKVFESDSELIYARTTIFRGPISDRERSQAEDTLSRRTLELLHDKRFGKAPDTDIPETLNIPDCQYLDDLTSIPGEGFVVLAHSFHDGLFYYGRDDFTSVFDWLTYSISLLTDLGQRVFIKLHPNVDYQRTNCRYSIDVHALRKICKTFRNCPNLFFVNPFLPLSDFKPFSSLRFVTRHGSGAVELAFMGLTCISSSKSPWRTDFSFSEATASRSELHEVIKAYTHPGRPLTLKDPSFLREEATIFTALESRRHERRLDLAYCNSIGLPGPVNPTSVHQLSLKLRSASGFTGLS